MDSRMDGDRISAKYLGLTHPALMTLQTDRSLTLLGLPLTHYSHMAKGSSPSLLYYIQAR